MFARGVSLALLAAGFAAGQATQWRGPVSGILFDEPARALRPLLGVPGGSYLGAPVAENVQAASIAPDGDTALAFDDGQLIVLRDLRGASPRRITLPGVLEQWGHVAWSPNSSMAVVCQPEQGRLARIRISNAGANVEVQEIHGMPRQIDSLAVNDDGSRLIAASREGETGGLYEISGGVANRVSPVTAPGPCAYGKTEDAFYCIDRDTGNAIRYAGGWQVLPLTGAMPAADAVGLAVARDGRSLLLARAEDRSVRAYDIHSGAQLSEAPVGAAPDRLSEVATGVFLLTSRQRTADPVWLLDARLQPFVFFVPGE